jgi:hypothetical protein
MRIARRCIGLDEELHTAAQQRAKELGYRSFSAFVAAMLKAEIDGNIAVINDDETQDANSV